MAALGPCTRVCEFTAIAVPGIPLSRLLVMITFYSINIQMFPAPTLLSHCPHSLPLFHKAMMLRPQLCVIVECEG